MADVARRESIRAGLVRLAIPISIGTITQPTFTTIEGAVVGRLPEGGTLALAAVAAGSTLFTYAWWTFGFLRISTTTAAAHAVAAHDRSALDSMVKRRCLTSFVIGLVVALLGPWFAHFAVAIFTPSVALREPIETYLATRVWALPAGLPMFVLTGTLIGLGRPAFAVSAELVRVAVEAIAATLFVWGFGWGVRGVAFAAVVAELGSAIVAMGLLLRTRRTVDNSRAGAMDLVQVQRELTTSAFDLIVRTQCLLASYALFARDGTQLGETFGAANGVLLNYYFYPAYVLSALGQATASMLGTARGNGRADDAREVLRSAVRIATWVSIVSTILIAFAGSVGIHAFTRDVAVVRVAQEFLPYAIALPLISMFAMIFDGAAVGGRRTDLLRNTHLLAVLAIVAVRYAADGAGNHRAWIAFLVFTAVRSGGFLYARTRIEGAFRLSEGPRSGRASPSP